MYPKTLREPYRTPTELPKPLPKLNPAHNRRRRIPSQTRHFNPMVNIPRASTNLMVIYHTPANMRIGPRG